MVFIIRLSDKFKLGNAMNEHVDFTAMKDGTKEEYELLARLETLSCSDCRQSD